MCSTSSWSSLWGMRQLTPLQLAGCRQGLWGRSASRACFKNRVVSRQGAEKPAPRKQILASELRDLFNHNRMVAVYHYNDLSTEEWSRVRTKMMKAGIKIKVSPSKVAVKALEGTRYRNISPLFRGCTAIAFGKDVTSLSALLSCAKAEAKLCLLGGLTDEQLFTPKGLQGIADLPSIEMLRGELAGILVLPQVTMTGMVQAGSQRLSTLLSQIVDSEAGATAQ